MSSPDRQLPPRLQQHRRRRGFHPPRNAPMDEVVVIGIVVGGSISFVATILNHVFKLGWLSLLAERVTFVMIPPLALIFLVLGSIYLGVATPTEGGAMGAMGALIMAVWRRRLPMPQLRNAMDATARLTAFVVFILIGARIFSLTFYAVDGHVWVESLLIGLPGGQIGFLVVVNLIVFVMAFFLDFFEIAFIVCRCWLRLQKNWASTSFGSASCWRSTCRLRSCIHRSVLPCSFCAALRRIENLKSDKASLDIISRITERIGKLTGWWKDTEQETKDEEDKIFKTKREQEIS